MTDFMKNRLRKVIRCLMILVGIVLLTVGLAVPIINNAIALKTERRLMQLPLPEGTTVADSISASGRLSRSGGDVEYFGAILLESNQSAEELQNYYVAYATDFQDCVVAEQTGKTVAFLSNQTVSFSNAEEGKTYYMVYSVKTGSGIWQWILNGDLR